MLRTTRWKCSNRSNSFKEKTNSFLTPLLHIKPYVPQFDSRENCEIGWFSGKVQDAEASRAEERFK
jgi:hypothetical protein